MKSVIRFNCVSKFWNTLISQPHFKKNHLNHAKNQARSQKLLCFYWPNKDDNNNRIHFYSYSLSLAEPVKDIVVVDCPSNSNPSYGVQIYCSCDGLFLIGIWTERHVPQPSLLLIWNPSTRESIVLTHSKFNGSDEFRCTYGLGYDSISDDYKVFRFVMTKNGQNKNEIFSLKNSSWKIIEENSSLDRMDCSMYYGGEFLPFVNGAFHWLGISSKSSVVSFNICVYRHTIARDRVLSHYI